MAATSTYPADRSLIQSLPQHLIKPQPQCWFLSISHGNHWGGKPPPARKQSLELGLMASAAAVPQSVGLSRGKLPLQNGVPWTQMNVERNWNLIGGVRQAGERKNGNGALAL